MAPELPEGPDRLAPKRRIRQAELIDVNLQRYGVGRWYMCPQK